MVCVARNEVADGMYCRAQRAPWVPSFATAFRLFLLVRVVGAMYSNIQDCDESAFLDFPFKVTLFSMTSITTSLQFLGAFALPGQRAWIPDLGNFSKILD